MDKPEVIIAVHDPSGKYASDIASRIASTLKTAGYGEVEIAQVVVDVSEHRVHGFSITPQIKVV